MAKVTSKCQVTVPKAIAQQYGIRPGDDIDWVAAGDVIRVIPSRNQGASGKSRREEANSRGGEATGKSYSTFRRTTR